MGFVPTRTDRTIVPIFLLESLNLGLNPVALTLTVPCNFLRLAKLKNKKYDTHKLELLEPGRKCWIFFIEEGLLLKEEMKDD